MVKTILIVDDSRSVRTVLATALIAAGYRVIDACDGKDALSKLNGDKVHLIISAVNMPNMDGITFLREVKKIPNHRHTPVCILTKESGQSEMKQGKDAGAEAWILKPIQPPKLLAAIEKLVSP